MEELAGQGDEKEKPGRSMGNRGSRKLEEGWCRGEGIKVLEGKGQS